MVIQLGIYPCVSCLSVPVCLVCLVKSTSVFFPYSFCYSPFSSPPGFDACLFLDSVPACLTILIALTTSLSATLYLLNSDLVLTFLPVHYHSRAYPFGLINIVRLQPSASCVCIWVSPCPVINTSFGRLSFHFSAANDWDELQKVGDLYLPH